MEEKKWKVTKVNLGGAIIGGAIALVVGIIIGLNWVNITGQFAPYLGGSKTSKNTANDWSALDEVYNELSSNYDGDLDKKALIEGAKKGLVEAVGDDYTEYMDAKTAEDFNKSLHGDVGAGIGVEMALRDGYVRVIRTLPDNPAKAAGILSGDILYKVNGEEVYTLNTDEIANKIRGEAGTEVTVTVVRDGKELDFTMTREKINNVSAYVEYDGDTAIITVSRFDTDTGTMVKKFAKELVEKGSKKVILDLRGNGGGYVSAAKDLLSLWIDGQTVLIQKSKLDKDSTTTTNKNEAILENMKTIALVNGSSASASEIVVGALKDYNKATVVGETTFGKGVVQTLLDLSNGTLLKVTTAHWYTPNNNSINGTGIKPDIEIVNTYDDINANRDPQMDKAKEL